MSDPNHPQAPAPQQPAPGWYPDGTGAVRWWDGAAWTAHAQGSASAAGPHPEVRERPRLADHLAVDSPWTWVIALAQLIAVPSIFLIDVRGYVRFLAEGDGSGFVSYFATTGIVALLGWALTALIIVAAHRDSKRLTALGVVRPFHWAFAFLGATVYLIGRHVVLRKVTRTPGWPLWANLACVLVSLAVTTIWTVMFMQFMLSEVATSPLYS